MFPLSDSIKSNKFPFITIFFIALNIYVFFKEVTSVNFEQFISFFALVPSTVKFSDPTTLLPFLTAIFLHGGYFHIISNMWFLWIFGDDVEAVFGYFKYIVLFIGAGLVGNFLQFFLDPSSSIPMLGASGAISGVLGAYYILFPTSRIKSIVFLFFIFTTIEIPAVIYLFYWFFVQLFSGITNLSNVTSQQGGVAFFAHVGGFITGVILAKSFLSKDKKGYVEGEIVG